MQHGRLLRMEGPDGGAQHPLGAAHQALATCINSDELAVLVSPPRAEAPGISLRDRGHFALPAPDVAEAAVSLGALIDGAGGAIGEVRAPGRALNEHVLVVGTPGSGKTNTCMRLLVEAHEQLGVPFLVIEPAKTEYRRLAGHPSLRGKLRVYSVGGEGAQLRLNPLRPAPGMDLLGHIDFLKAVFNASFAMFPGMPQILEQALIEAYERRGWNLYTSRNEAAGLDARLTPDELEALLPCLGDLQEQVTSVLNRRTYSEEVRRNIGAALGSRLGSLRMGNKGLILDTRRSTPLGDLFERPAVLELNNLRDDEEKSFVMALVLVLLSQHAEARQAQFSERGRETLQHVTLIEEAHRLLAAGPRGGGESADPRGKGVAIFTDMLAELRALGEGFVVAEQIPTKLASDVLKNTNLKIIHRLTAPSDCAVLGDAANLDAAQLRYLVSLPMGTAVVHGLRGRAGDAVAGAALVRVHSIKDALRGAAPDTAPAASAEAVQRLGGCHACAAPCAYFPSLQRSLAGRGGSDAFRDFAEALLLGDVAETERRFEAWRAAAPLIDPGKGPLFCAFVHAAARWTETVLTARGVIDEESGERVMRPADRLLAHRLSKAFGTAGRALVDGPAAAGPSLERLRAALLPALASSERNAGLPACADCPAPCQALAFVAGRGLTQLSAELAQALPKSPVNAFGRPAETAMLWEKVRQVLSPPGELAPALPGGVFDYCRLANAALPLALEPYRAALLARAAPAPA
jgi:DNA helicase HerA-like ATPase